VQNAENDICANNPFFQPNLVRVLSIILRFTPQETRRLIAKVQ
jgi:hypothetical protein